MKLDILLPPIHHQPVERIIRRCARATVWVYASISVGHPGIDLRSHPQSPWPSTLGAIGTWAGTRTSAYRGSPTFHTFGTPCDHWTKSALDFIGQCCALPARRGATGQNRAGTGSARQGSSGQCSTASCIIPSTDVHNRLLKYLRSSGCSKTVGCKAAKPERMRRPSGRRSERT